MNERKLTADDITEIAGWINPHRTHLADLIHDLAAAEKEVRHWIDESDTEHRKKLRVMQELRETKAEVERLREALEVDPEALARLFHEVYEAQAPMFGYETKPETRCAWEEMPEDNKQLMVSVCRRIVGVLKAQAALDKSDG